MNNPKFSIRFVSLNESQDAVNKYNPKKASQATNIPVKILEGNKGVSSYIYYNFHNALSNCSFPIALKYADVKCLKRTIKLITQYPSNIHPNLNHVYERLMYEKMYPFLIKSFLELQFSFRKGFNKKQCLIHTIEK